MLKALQWLDNQPVQTLWPAENC